METDSYNNIGSLKISEDVIATIAGVATSEIKGVAGLSPRPGSGSSGILGLIGKKAMNKSIHLEMRDSEAVIDIYVNLYLGTKIPDTAAEIQSRVKDAVQTMTGIAVSKINVHISGVVIQQDETGEIL